MKQYTFKHLALTLALGVAVVCAALPFSVGATSVDAGAAGDTVSTNVASVTIGSTVTEYESLTGALAAANAAGTSEENRATIKLLSDVDITNTLSITGYVTLDLNNHVIDANDGNFMLLTVDSSANFILTDTSETQTAHYVDWGSTNTKYIVSDTVPETTTYTTFTGGYLTGCALSGTVSQASVYLDGGTFTMQGGAIAGNTVSYHNDCVGGVYVASGSFIMSGGTITGNYAKIGGVCVTGGSFVMSGGSITNNYATDKAGGVHSTSSFTMSGSASITDNYAGDKGGGVNIDGGTFTMQADADGNIPTISGNTATNGGGLYVDCDSATISAGNITDNTATTGGGICVINTSMALSGNVTISGNTATESGGGVYALAYNASVVMSEGVIITDNTATNGGGVYVKGESDILTDDGVFILNGGTISENTATESGGGVYVYASVSSTTTALTITGGTISENTAATSGGGIYVEAYTPEDPVGGYQDPGDTTQTETEAAAAVTFAKGSIITITKNTSGAQDDKIADNISLQEDASLAVASELAQDSKIGLTTAQDGAVALTSAVETSAFISDATGSEIVLIQGADGEYLVPSDDIIAMVQAGDTRIGYSSLTGVDGAFTAANAAGTATITLLADVSTETAISLADSNSSTEVNITLDLNNHSITYTGGESASVITVGSGVTFTLTDGVAAEEATSHYVYYGYADSAYKYLITDDLSQADSSYTTITGGYITGGSGTVSGSYTYGGGVYVSGSFIMQGGNLAVNSADYGAGVCVAKDASFAMSGGTIAGNIATRGGGVWTNSGTSFAMSGTASITSNRVSSGNGAGVFVNDTFTLSENASISNNYGNASAGAGVYLNGGTFTMEGGSITGNTTTSTGGGVYLSGGSFTMAGGSITDNYASSDGGGVAVNGATFTMAGGSITENRASSDGGGVYVSSGSVALGDDADGATESTIAITDNTVSNSANNVYTASATSISVVGALSAESSVGITLSGTTGAFTTAGVRADGVFTADNSSYSVLQTVANGRYTYSIGNAVASVTVGSGDDAACSEYTSFEDARIAELTADTSIAETVTITLLADVTTTETVAIQGAVDITLDLNGYGIIYTGTGSDSASVIKVASSASLTLVDSASEVTTHYAYYYEGNTRYYFGTSVEALQETLDTLLSASSTAETITITEADCITFTGGYITGGTSSGVYVYGSFTMQGGTIVGNSATNGGGVYVAANGSFTMQGGSILYNSASSASSASGRGGGVYLYSGSFIMQDGTIAYNSASGGGGGVTVAYTGASFTLVDGSIAYNTASFGGGIYFSGGSFTMQGGSITYNSATDGGGVYSEDAGFTILAGSITNNTATTGGGLYLAKNATLGADPADADAPANGTITITDNTIGEDVVGNVYLKNIAYFTVQSALAANSKVGVTFQTGAGTFTTAGVQAADVFFADEAEYLLVESESMGSYTYTLVYAEATVTVGDTTTRYASLTEALAAANEAGTATITLLVDAYPSASLVFTGRDITLDLNGKYIQYWSDGDSTASVITVENGAGLTLTDTGENPTTYYVYYEDYANYPDSDFQPEYVVMDWDPNDGYDPDPDAQEIACTTFTGGYIAGGTGTSGYGGGVYVAAGGSFTMQAGSIVGNSVSSDTVASGGGVYVAANGSFTMQGGSILGNSASGDFAAFGGGVYVAANGSFTMQGGNVGWNSVSVTQTVDNTFGAGVFVDNNASFTISGGATVTANGTDDTTGDGVYLPTNQSIKVSGALTGASVTFTTNATATATAAVLVAEPSNEYTIVSTDLTAFVKAVPTAPGGLERTADGEIQLAVYTLTFAANGGTLASGASSSVTLNAGETATMPSAAYTGYTLTGWSCDDGKTILAAGSSTAAVHANATYTAAWAISVPTVSITVTDSDATLAAPSDGSVSYGESVTLTAAYTAIADVSYTYAWYQDDSTQVYATTQSIKLTNVADSARYTVSVTATRDGYTTATASSSAQSVTITKASNAISDLTFAGWTYGSYDSTTNAPSADASFGGDTITYAYYADAACETAITPSSTLAAGTYYLKASVAGTDDYAAASDVISFTVQKATATLMQGETVIATGTIVDGTVVFEDGFTPEAGEYNLVATLGDLTQTTIVTVTQAGEEITATVPTGTLNTTVNVAGDTAVVAGGLGESALDTAGSEALAAGEQVDLDLAITQKTKTQVAADATRIEGILPSDEVIGLYFDITLTQSIYSGDALASVVQITALENGLVQVIVPLPEALQGKESYTVYRAHQVFGDDGSLLNTEVHTITTTPNADGEYIALSSDGTVLSMYLMKFSTYAISYQETMVEEDDSTLPDADDSTSPDGDDTTDPEDDDTTSDGDDSDDSTLPDADDTTDPEDDDTTSDGDDSDDSTAGDTSSSTGSSTSSSSSDSTALTSPPTGEWGMAWICFAGAAALLGIYTLRKRNRV